MTLLAKGNNSVSDEACMVTENFESCGEELCISTVGDGQESNTADVEAVLQSASSSSTAPPNETTINTTKKLTPFQSSCILVNYISVGYILLPGAFALGGTLLTPICLAFVSLQSYISGVFVLEACARAEALKSSTSDTDGHIMDQSDGSDRTSSSSKHNETGQSSPRNSKVMVYERTFELSELCRFFMGRHLRNFFTLTAMGDLYGLTWALAVVFGSALADAIPMSADASRDYKIYVLIFGIVTATLACFSLPDQVAVQLTFLAARLVMVTLMVVTTAVAYVSDTPQFGSQLGPQRDVPLAEFRNLVGTLVLCVFSTAFQFSVPHLTGETRNKKRMVPVLKASVSFVYTSNLVLSLVMAAFFGLATNQSSNLNWVDYHGGTWTGEDSVSQNRAGWATFISKYIVLFAAIDGLAVCPLCAISLGDIIMGGVYEDRVHEIQDQWKTRTLFRLLASIPQVVAATFVTDLGVIAKYTGIFTLLSYTVCPSLLTILGRRRMEAEGLLPDTYYRTLFSTSACAWGLTGLSTASILGVVLDSYLNV